MIATFTADNSDRLIHINMAAVQCVTTAGKSTRIDVEGRSYLVKDTEQQVLEKWQDWFR